MTETSNVILHWVRLTQEAKTARRSEVASMPGELDDVRKAVTGNASPPPEPFTFSLASSPNLNRTKAGTLYPADSSTFKVSTTVAAVVQTLPPAAVREMHWHPNADEWQYYIKGKARMGVFNTGPHVLSMDFNPGDIDYVPKTTVIMCKISATQICSFSPCSGQQTFSLSDWLAHSSAGMVAEHLNVDPAVVAQWPGAGALIVPGRG